MEDLKNIMNEILGNEENIIMTITSEGENREVLKFVAFSLFAYLSDYTQEALDYFQITVEDDYPGVTIHIVPINSEIPSDAVTIRVKTIFSDILSENKNKLKSYAKSFRNNPELEMLYGNMKRKTKELFRGKEFNVKGL